MSGYDKISTKQKAFLICHGIFQSLVAVFITSTIWLMAYNRNWRLLHTWHVFLSTIGFAFLMPEAVAFFNPGNVLTLGCGKATRRYLHGILMCCAIISVIAGVSIKIRDKNNNNFAHFTTTHGILGLTAFLLTILTFFGGIIVMFARVLHRIFGIRPVILQSVHIIFGILAYIIGSVALGYGIKDYFSEALNTTREGLVVIFGIYVGISLIRPLMTLFRL